MRLWHYKMISVLPRKQLLGQFRECAAIASMLNNDNLNHFIVNRVKDYDRNHFIVYCKLIIEEMHARNFKTAPKVLELLEYGKAKNIIHKKWSHDNVYLIDDNYKTEQLFSNYHNDRYLYQCLMYFQEKHDCKGITDEEYNKMYSKFKNEFDNLENLT